MYFIKRNLFVSILITLFHLSAFCDDTVFEGKGETVWPINNDQIEMVEEEVVLTGTTNIGSLYGTNYYVNCNFVFKNSGEDTDLQIGFPDYPGGESDEEPTIRNFKCYVEGNPEVVEIKKGIASPINSTMIFDRVFVWQVKFKKGETKTIRNTYDFNGFSSASGHESVEYVLRTGALWKGPIGKAKITVNGIDTRFICSIKPQGYTIIGDSISWVMNNIEPKSDILVKYYAMWMSFVHRSEIFFSKSKHTDAEIKEFVRYLPYFNIMGNGVGEIPLAITKGYVQRIVNTIPDTYFREGQMDQMLALLEQKYEEDDEEEPVVKSRIIQNATPMCRPEYDMHNTHTTKVRFLNNIWLSLQESKNGFVLVYVVVIIIILPLYILFRFNFMKHNKSMQNNNSKK